LTDDKDGERYFDSVYENETSSTLTLQGNENERGTYECRWNNSRGEARQRNFFVSFKLVEEQSTVIIFTTLIGLFAVGMGIGIKFYLDKVRNKFRLRQIVCDSLPK
jgi:uncharacterized protein YodC (DUF2158 family)